MFLGEDPIVPVSLAANALVVADGRDDDGDDETVADAEEDELDDDDLGDEALDALLTASFEEDCRDNEMETAISEKSHLVTDQYGLYLLRCVNYDHEIFRESYDWNKVHNTKVNAIIPPNIANSSQPRTAVSANAVNNLIDSMFTY
jgi:hypothetical protein